MFFLIVVCCDSYEVGSLRPAVQDGHWFNKSWNALWEATTQSSEIILALDARVSDIDRRLQLFEQSLQKLV